MNHKWLISARRDNPLSTYVPRRDRPSRRMLRDVINHIYIYIYMYTWRRTSGLCQLGWPKSQGGSKTWREHEGTNTKYIKYTNITKHTTNTKYELWNLYILQNKRLCFKHYFDVFMCFEIDENKSSCSKVFWCVWCILYYKLRFWI